MPANLTPQYKKAEEEYRRATTPEDELRCLEVMLKEIPKHKGTEKLQSDLKSKISKLKKDVEHERKSGGKRAPGFKLTRQGAGTAAIIGGPNAGKSQLVRTLTRATPEVAPYPFTTRVPLPGMMPWHDVFVQLIDTPPITKDYFEPYMQGLIRAADVAILMVDLGCDEGIEQCQELIDRLNQTKTRLGEKSSFDEEDIGLSYTQTLVAPNKMDLPEAAERLALFRELCPLGFPIYPISAADAGTLEELRSAIYRSLDVVRVYTKLPHAKEPDREKPFTVRRGSTILEVAELIHKDLASNFKFARVWGTQVHPATVVKDDYVPADQDVIEVHAV
ncbi:MAG: 50S ribosome-binding GTPase [Planctomycetia bacterium]|nr:50S ribosome-binding GTPase [Planctomycetia bacterium]